MGKQIVVYVCIGILFIYKLEWSTDLNYNIDEIGNILSGKNDQTQKATYGTIPFIWIVQNRQIQKVH